jgi:F-type H+-transporting ATPase subunit b
VKVRSVLQRATFASLLLVAASQPLTAFADKEAKLAADADEEATHEEGHHGRLTFHEIIAGEEALQFWGAVVNFGLLLWVIRRLGKQPLANFLTDRRNKIERGIQEAAAVKAKAEAVFNEYTERMKSLDSELTKLRSDIAKAAAQDRQQIVADAEEAAKRVKADTEELVARQAEQLETEIRREVVQAAIDAAERAVREVATADDQRRLADAFVREIAKVKPENRA